MNDNLLKRSDVIDTVKAVLKKYSMSWNPNGKRDGEFCKDLSVALLNIPIAYSVENVIKELEDNEKPMNEKRCKTSSGTYKKYYKAIETKKAIEIVKRGGIGNIGRK